MEEISLAVRIDKTIHRLAKMRATEHKMTLKEYVIYLIMNDVKDNAPINLESVHVPTDNKISEESVNEARKVLDFVSNR
jgi:hypothetical protein